MQRFRMKQNPMNPMFKYQKDLPMLPVPSLEETCARYYQSVIPLLKTDQDKQRTKTAIETFLKSPQSKTLQDRLLKRREDMAKLGKSWLIDWWNDWAYMSYRDSVVLNVSYFFHFQDDPYRRNQTTRAAHLLSQALNFRNLVINEQLSPDTGGRGDKVHGLCMNQYQFMFNSTRIPKIPSDDTNNCDPHANHHVAVVRKGKFFTFETIVNGKQLSEGEIEVQLDKIKKLADSDGWEPNPIGVLTSDNRDRWANTRDSILSHAPSNQSTFQKLESAILLICLDDESPITRSEVGSQLWHGDARNRYYDKSLQFIIFENGKAGFLGEHSLMDATPNYRMVEGILNHGLKNPPQAKPSNFTAPVSQLHFQLPNETSSMIAAAASRLAADVARHDHHVLAYEGYGKSHIKKYQLSPDSLVQLSIQLAYYKLFGESRATYESSQTKKFAWGRTEVCRSMSESSVACLKALSDPHVDSLKKAEWIRKAIKSHSEYMALAVNGLGVDRHLLGLRLSLKPGEPTPSIFADPVYAESCHWYISTSQVTSEYFDGWGWGEVCPDGYGIAYMIKNNSIHYNIAALQGGASNVGPGCWRGAGKGLLNPCSKMAHTLQESLNEIRYYLDSELKVKSAATAKL